MGSGEISGIAAEQIRLRTQGIAATLAFSLSAQRNVRDSGSQTIDC
jgi:hypothetical protein